MNVAAEVEIAIAILGVGAEVGAEIEKRMGVQVDRGAGGEHRRLGLRAHVGAMMVDLVEAVDEEVGGIAGGARFDFSEGPYSSS